MIIVGAKGAVTFGTFALPRVVSGAQAVVAENVEALGEHGILALHFARWTRERLLVIANLLDHHFIDGGARHLHLLHAFSLSFKLCQLLLQSFCLVGLRF